MNNNKNFFGEIPSIEAFIVKERLKKGIKFELNKFDYLVIEKVRCLCRNAENLIKDINYQKFKESMSKLIKLDVKIASYLFFLIDDYFLDYRIIHRLVDKESLKDYYASFSYEENLNTFKVIYHG
ncbi:hypothetical protein [Enterococcus gallinarum]|uniref:hypothetical protein n=1 Tax=Enterococcus gallinarum TaxID=1353 RepID=UPI0039BFC8BF